MQLRQLGQSDVKISPVIFGAWAIGGWMWGGNEEKDSIDAIRAAIDQGVNTIDTAAVYGMGYNEELVGCAIKGMRDKMIITSRSPPASSPCDIPRSRMRWACIHRRVPRRLSPGLSFPADRIRH